MRPERASLVLLRCLVLLLVPGPPGGGGLAQTRQNSGSSNFVHVEMSNVMYHFTSDIAVHIAGLEGELVPTTGSVPVFDDKNSFLLQIRSAIISINVVSMANVLNEHVFVADDAPLKNLSLAVQGKQLKIKGRLHSKGDLPFELVGSVSATPGGKIRIQAQSMKAAHIPVKALADLLGVKLTNLINTKKIRGVRIEKDDFFLNPEQILPPPQIQGHVTSVRLQGNEIVQQFGTELPHPRLTGNYMAYRGAQLRFGKLTMSDTDMVLIDMDPKDPFDFYLDHYKEQLVAGYTKTTPAFGLRVFMRDFNKLHRRPGNRKQEFGARTPGSEP